MGKGRKNRKAQTAFTPAPAHDVSRVASPIFAPGTRRLSLKRMLLQFAAILSLSTALGFVFNTANPIGVRFEIASSVATDPRSALATNSHALAANSLAAAPPLPATSRKLTPAPVTPPALTPAPTPVSTPFTSVASTVVPTRTPVVITNPPPLPAQAAAAVAPTNPAPIHWREAKPLAASGQAVLVDVRARPIYDAGHIPNAVSLPETSSPAEFAAFLKLVPTNTTLIVYCASTSCSQSKRVADRLVTEFHYAPVRFMTGGYQEYQQEELAKPQPPPINQ